MSKPTPFIAPKPEPMERIDGYVLRVVAALETWVNAPRPIERLTDQDNERKDQRG